MILGDEKTINGVTGRVVMCSCCCGHGVRHCVVDESGDSRLECDVTLLFVEEKKAMVCPQCGWADPIKEDTKLYRCDTDCKWKKCEMDPQEIS